MRASFSLALMCTAACGAARDANTSCAPSLPPAFYDYSDASAPIPPHFMTSPAGGVAFTDKTPRDNPITNAGATLGRVLFHDARLSADASVSCASCHQQQFGFGDTARFSIGAHGARTIRRTMALANARFYARARYASDEHSASLEAQVLAPFGDVHEFAMSVDSAIARLTATSYYPALFAAAFGSRDVTSSRIAAALAQFVRTLVSSRSRFDSVFATGGAPNRGKLSSAEQRGFQLFNEKGCVNCHRTIAQIPDQANNNGLDTTPEDTGAGRARFKPASLRNIAIRPPYMHDGRFRTLAEVVAFYDSNVQPSADLDLRLRNVDGSPRRLHLRETDRAAIVAFLEALTDSSFLHDARFADPFACRRRR